MHSGQCLRTRQASRPLEWQDETRNFIEVEFSPDGKAALPINGSPEAKIWSTTSGECLQTLRVDDESAIVHAGFSRDGRIVVALVEPDGNRVLEPRIWDTTSGECLCTLDVDLHNTLAWELSPDGKTIAVSLVKGTRQIWSTVSGECLHTLDEEMLFRAGRNSQTRFSPDGQMVVAASRDSTAKIWSTRTGECLCTLRGHQGEVCAAKFSPSAQTVLTASTDCTAKLWSTVSGDCLRTLRGHGASLHSATFS